MSSKCSEILISIAASLDHLPLSLRSLVLSYVLFLQAAVRYRGGILAKSEAASHETVRYPEITLMANVL